MKRRGFLKGLLLSSALLAVSRVLPMQQVAFEPAPEPARAGVFGVFDPELHILRLSEPVDLHEHTILVAVDWGFPGSHAVHFEIVDGYIFRVKDV